MRILVLADLDDLHWRGASEGADLVVACGGVAGVRGSRIVEVA